MNGKINYVVVTATKNEEMFLPDIAHDLINQTIKPTFWIIVDDGSFDRTWTIITSLQKDFSWIKGIKANYKGSCRYGHNRVTKITQKGFQYGITLCNLNNNGYDLLTAVDADVRLNPQYFEKIAEQFRYDKKLGVASGFVHEPGMSLNKTMHMNILPRGCALVFRRICYEMIGGYQGHSNSLIKAQNRNWKVRTFPAIKILHRRKTGSITQYYFSQGEYAYYINCSPLTIFINIFYFFLEGSPKKGFKYLAGYMSSLFLKKRQIDDYEIKQYYWNIVPRYCVSRYNSRKIQRHKD